MTQEDKELLLKDLCARLPYGVIVDTPKGKGRVCDINLTIFGTEVGVNINPTVRDTFSINDVKPYLFPLSSMTEEQIEELGIERDKDTLLLAQGLRRIGEGDKSLKGKLIAYNAIDWLNKNHFDFRNLIGRGLAIDCTNLNIY